MTSEGPYQLALHLWVIDLVLLKSRVNSLLMQSELLGKVVVRGLVDLWTLENSTLTKKLRLMSD